MNNLNYNEEKLVGTLERLQPNSRVAFAAACAERLLQTSYSLSKSAHNEDPRELRHILNRLWLDVEGDRMSDSEVEDAIAKCLLTVEELESEPVKPEAAGATDAVAALCYALRCRKSGESNDAMWASRRAYECLDNYVINQENIDTNQPNGEQEVLSNTLIQAELARQRRDLDDLLSNEMKLTTLHRLRQRAVADAGSFFGAKSS